MIIPFGNPKGRTVASALLNDPLGIWSLLSAPETGPLAEIQREALRLIAIFNAKPILAPCWVCRGPATRFIGFAFESKEALPLCDQCEPREIEGGGGEFWVIRTCEQALSFIIMGCFGASEEYTDFIRAMARHKGLPSPYGEAEAEAFFELIPPVNGIDIEARHPGLEEVTDGNH